MKNKFHLIIVLTLVLIISILGLTLKKEEYTVEIEQPKAIEKTIEKTIERRRVEVSIDKMFEINRDNLEFTTNSNGEFSATYKITHNTKKEETLIFYALIEGVKTPIIMDVKGKKAPFHFIKVPKDGELQINFTLSDLPGGKHIIYLINEKYNENNISDELEKIQSQKVFSENFFSLDVKNGNNNLLEVSNYFKTVEKLGDSIEGNLFSMQLYEDHKHLIKANVVGKNNYYLVINNDKEFELRAHLKLLSDYSSEELEQIIIPANSRVGLPVNLDNLKAHESIRFILLGEPTSKLDIQIPVRFIQKSERIPIKQKGI
ncbi:MAG: hypothetical protein ABGX20_11350 [Bacillus sp. (in: firmicutes)]